MDPQLLPLVAFFSGLVAGAALGWFFGSRPLAELRARFAARDGEARELDEKFRRAITELGDSRIELATLNANASNFDEQKRLLLEAQESLKKEFEAAGAKVLEGAQEVFLKRAADRFSESEKTSAERMRSLLEPVGQSLAKYEAQVGKMEKERVEGFGQLGALIQSVRDGQDRVIDGANRISTSIRGATKLVGDWGELQFLNLLESCGLSSMTDFECQVSVKGSDGLLRPDGVINIPGGRKLVVDVKNVFNTYAAANEAGSEEQRLELLRGHAREIRGHIDNLAAKRYQDYIDGSADFVVMFIPGEHVLYTALSMDSELLNYALKKNVVLSSPLNFMSIALTITTVWRQANAQVDAEEIVRLGKELYDRLGIVAGHMSSLRKSLHSTNQHFDALVGSFDTNLRRTGERFEKLAIDTSAKDLLEAPPLNIIPRRLTNFSDDDEEQIAQLGVAKGEAPEAL